MSDNTITISNVSFSGSTLAVGSFENGVSILGIDSGVLLSTGNINTGKANLGQPGDTDLSAMTGLPTNDAVSLEFDFIPKYSNVTFNYVFGSREYPTWVGSSFNDSFAFFINGVNQALIPGTTDSVSINNVNAGNNSQYFIDNTDDHLGSLSGTTFGGITTVLPINATVIPNQTNHIKIVIADTSDYSLNSFVGIASNSFKATGKIDGYYKDEDGNTISEDFIIDGNVGDTYAIDQKEINGYKFLYWIGEPTGTISDTNISVTAVYKKIKNYIVNFESNDGSIVTTQTVEESKLAVLPKEPTKTGYTFKGWYIDEQLTTLYDFSTPVIQDITLYAEWEKDEDPVGKEYKVIFESNGGSTVTTQTVEESKLAVMPKEPTKTGYTFKGWYTDDTLMTVFDFNTPITKDVTLYAKWEKYDKGSSQVDKNKNDSRNGKNNNNQSNSLGKYLPKTGEVKSYLPTLALILSMMLIILIWMKKRLNFKKDDLSDFIF